MQLDTTTDTRVSDLQSYAFLWFEAALEPMHALLGGLASARRRFAEESAGRNNIEAL